MNKCHYSQKENYWSYITKRVAAMNNNQLILLYDIHTDFLLDSELNEDQVILLYDIHEDFLLEPTMGKENQIRRYNSFKELTYDRLVHYTWTVNYPTLRQVVDLILAGYDYYKVVEIVFAVLPPWAREH